jgi:hypothetical protein
MNQILTLPQHILMNAMSLITSISEAMVVYFDEEMGHETMVRRGNSNKKELEEVACFEPAAVRPSLRDKNWQWLTDSEMPFSKQLLSKEQNRTLFDENKVRNLQISLLNKSGESILVCYFVFGEQNPLFGHASELALTTENKTLIANMMSNYILQLRTLYNQQLDNTRFLHEQFRYTEQQLKQLYQKNESSRDIRGDMIGQFCELRLSEFSNTYGIDFELSISSHKELSGRNIGLMQVDDILFSAVNRLKAMFPLEKRLVIEPWHLMFETDLSENPIETSSMNDVRFSRTLDLLNKLEEAGKRVKKLHLKLTGTNVGMHCETPISAPAITDALRKHSNRIVKLMNLYPDRWSLLRTYFRPLQNLLDLREEKGDVGVG